MANQDLETHEETKSPGALLADDFYAEPKETQPEEPVQPEEVTQPEETTEIEEPAETTDEETFEPTSLEQLAEHLETEPEWFEGLTVSQKVNGKEVEVKLADALSTHRKVKAGDDYLADAKTKAKATIDEAGVQKQEIAATAVVLGELLKEAESQLDSDSKEVDWARLRKEDPAEYSAKKDDIKERRDSINQMKLKAAQAFQQSTQNLTAQQQVLREQRLPKEREILLESLPEWGDSDVAQKEQTEVVKYLIEKGYTEKDIEVASYDAKTLTLAVNSMRYEKSKGKVEAAKKKVVKVPKVLKPGKSADETKPKVDSTDRVSILYGSDT